MIMNIDIVTYVTCLPCFFQGAQKSIPVPASLFYSHKLRESDWTKFHGSWNWVGIWTQVSALIVQLSSHNPETEIPATQRGKSQGIDQVGEVNQKHSGKDVDGRWLVVKMDSLHFDWQQELDVSWQS